jgi:3alpha(or 20beta)-hydroxysteroid dehydrogenase
MELSDRVAIVTGAARGQGAEHARRFIDEGAYVALADVRDCDELADSLGDRAQPYELDVARGSDWASMVEDVVDRWGRVDILVNVLNVNVVGTYLGMATAGGAMAASGGGSIVNVSSMMGKRGSDRLPAYAASKWAIRGLTQSAAIELAPQSIRVNTVMPGIIDTDMVRNWVGMADEAEILSRNDHRLLIKRLGISEDVTEAVLYLASDRASYVTGTDIVIDGGWTIS